MMLLLKIVDEGLVALVALGSQCAYLDEGVGASADGRSDQNGPVAVHSLCDYVHDLHHVLCVGHR